MHPVPFLSKWTSTLEELSCKCWHTYPDAQPLSLFTEVYPKMRKLQIEYDYHLVAAHYIRAFPNLVSLHLWTGHTAVIPDVQNNAAAERIDALRDENMQMQHRLGLDSLTSYWQHLDEYTGSLTHLYILGLTCRICAMRFDEAVSEAHLPLLLAVLSHAQPVHLKIHGWAALLDHPTHRLAWVLQQADCARRLESLAIHLTLHSLNKRDMDVALRFDELATMLAGIPGPLRRLRLRVTGHVSHLSRPSRSKTPPQLGVLLSQVDAQAYVQKLVKAIPTLTDVVIVIDGRWVDRHGGTFRRTDGDEPDWMKGVLDPTMYEVDRLSR
ncbi:hypothetical protein C8Q76DRAFT_139706 [Earliella scabrosa]|nr:hypothetical protein C8Q76DRAFT_139706 [Earliella scabrosa]